MFLHTLLFFLSSILACMVFLWKPINLHNRLTLCLLPLSVAYLVEKPPTILFRHQMGPIAQSNDGKLIVYPGSVLSLECLWLR